MAVYLKPLIPPAILPLTPGNPTMSSSVPILSQDSVSALSQSYINTQLLQASRSQHSGVTRSVVSPPVTATLINHSSSPTVTTPAHSNQLLNFNVKIFNPLKKDFDTYVLRAVSKDAISTPALLQKELLKQQFGGRQSNRVHKEWLQTDHMFFSRHG